MWSVLRQWFEYLRGADRVSTVTDSSANTQYKASLNDLAASIALTNEPPGNGRPVGEAPNVLETGVTATEPKVPAAGGTLLGDYRLSGFDELMAPDGTIRPHWRDVAAFLSERTEAQLHGMSERIQRSIVENGLTLDSFADPDNAEQPWQLGLLPFVISSAEFAFLERAVIQRMRIYEALLADLYGDQTSLADQLLPQGLIFNDPSFLRPVHGVPFDVPRLNFLALDLARDETGRWRIIDTHAETLAGHGYALANRVVLAEICSNLFRKGNTRRISSFYQEVASELATRSGSSAPNIAILGPPPNHETYLDHAYMARYLGYLLLQGSDLKVVGDKVFQKTLAGLQPIDLIVRAVEAAKADPLELDPNGFLGPAALVQSVRQRPALVVNALGTAIVENRGLAPYLAKLSQALIGEDLLIADEPRVWLGDAQSREHVLANIDSYLIGRAYEETARPGHARVARRALDLDDQHRTQLIEELKLNGESYVAQVPTTLGTAPAWTPNGLAPKPTAIRLFATFADGKHIVMPGGLAMVVDQINAVGLTSETALSSDIWVLNDEPEGPHYSRWRISEQDSQVRRLGAQLPSRIADNLYWLGRYVERADWTLRVMRNALNRGDDDLRPIRRTDAAESALGIIEAKWSGLDPNAASKTDQAATLEDRVEALFSTGQNPYGIRTTFQNIRRLAGQTRDRLSLDACRLLNDLTDPTRQERASAVDLVSRISDRIAELAAFNGLMHENMTRNFGWRFMDLGRRLERTSQMAELLRRMLVQRTSESDETERLAFLLETADSFMTYRSRYRFAPTFPLVLDLLLVDETNPRSLAFQLVAISEHMTRMPQASLDAVRTPEQRLALDILTQVRLGDIEGLRGANEQGVRENLAAMLDGLLTQLPELSDTISRRYFSLTEEQPHRVHTRLAP